MLKLDHVAVRVRDLDAAISFYTGKLGMQLLFRTIDEAHREAFCFLQLEGANLELLQSLDDQGRPERYSPPPIREPYCPHLAIAADDLDTLMAEWRKVGGIRIVKGPMEIPDRVRWVYIRDPDNNIIEFVEWLGS
jgi:catechol 2,3-dioxygenase-like lactoylglutathione lyase family enzyme